MYRWHSRKPRCRVRDNIREGGTQTCQISRNATPKRQLNIRAGERCNQKMEFKNCQPRELTPVPSRIHPNWLEAYYHYTSQSESPDLFHFWTAVSTIAGALRRQVWIDERFFHWTPNFYIIMVGPAGVVSKSTSARIGMKLLSQVEGITFGPKSMTWQGLTVALSEAQRMVPFGMEEDFSFRVQVSSCPSQRSTSTSTISLSAGRRKVPSSFIVQVIQLMFRKSPSIPKGTMRWASLSATVSPCQVMDLGPKVIPSTWLKSFIPMRAEVDFETTP